MGRFAGTISSCPSTRVRTVMSRNSGMYSASGSFIVNFPSSRRRMPREEVMTFEADQKK